MQWQIDTLTPSPAAIDEKLSQFASKLDESTIPDLIELSQEISQLLREFESYVLCRASNDTSDTQINILQDKYAEQNAHFDTLSLKLDEHLTQSSEPLSFPWEERKQLAKKRRSYKEEKLVNALSVNGYHGWSNLYFAQVDDLTFPMQNQILSFGQVENHLFDPNRTLRQSAMKAIDSAFRAKENLFAITLNNLSGFRLQNSASLGIENPLTEPLQANRMQRATLDAMWQAITDQEDTLKDFLRCKAALHGLDSLAWYDVEAPIHEDTRHIPYDEACQFILDHFALFSPKLADFSQKALSSQWIEAEDRPGKRPGGFCTDFPIKKESRIFMTYSGTLHDIFTLAHELGHAFHNHVVHDLPEMEQQYKMNVAETASIMAENIVIDAAIAKARDETEKEALIIDKANRALTFLLNIRARFLFEYNFYQERKKGFLPASEINTLMESAQKEAYANSLSSYHPLFWAAKLHFFFTETAFYNFPYTFGYLFSHGIRKANLTESTYIALLRDTGRMPVEELAKKHLDADLTSPTFWDQALSAPLADFSQLNLNV